MIHDFLAALLVAWLLTIGIGIAWIALLPVRIATRVLWRLLMAVWHCGAWLARHA